MIIDPIERFSAPGPKFGFWRSDHQLLCQLQIAIGETKKSFRSKVIDEFNTFLLTGSKVLLPRLYCSCGTCMVGMKTRITKYSAVCVCAFRGLRFVQRAIKFKV